VSKFIEISIGVIAILVGIALIGGLIWISTNFSFCKLYLLLF